MQALPTVQAWKLGKCIEVRLSEHCRYAFSYLCLLFCTLHTRGGVCERCVLVSAWADARAPCAAADGGWRHACAAAGGHPEQCR